MDANSGIAESVDILKSNVAKSFQGMRVPALEVGSPAIDVGLGKVSAQILKVIDLPKSNVANSFQGMRVPALEVGSPAIDVGLGKVSAQILKVIDIPKLEQVLGESVTRHTWLRGTEGESVPPFQFAVAKILQGIRFPAMRIGLGQTLKSIVQSKDDELDSLSKLVKSTFMSTVAADSAALNPLDPLLEEVQPSDSRLSRGGIVQPDLRENAVYGGNVEQAQARVNYVVVSAATAIVIVALMAAPHPLPWILQVTLVRSLVWHLLYYGLCEKWPEGEMAEIRKIFGK